MSGMLRFRAICLISLALLPGAWFAWQGREMPAAGYYHDDGLYYVGAQALAQTGEYRITSLPEQPYQTKYPPLWPLVLSLAWQIEPRYPENLPWAMLLAWMWLPVTLLAYRAWLRQAGAEAQLAPLRASLEESRAECAALRTRCASGEAASLEAAAQQHWLQKRVRSI
jgi:hypothetical protein